MNRRVTMRDVARHLGVDPSTVSLALRDHPRIPSPTREKIRRAAERLGYAPDPMLGALATYRRSAHTPAVTAEIGWVNRWVPPERFHAFREFDGYWQGAREAAREAGYRLERFHLGDAPLSRLERILRARNIRGLLIPPHHGACNDWSGLDCSGLAVVRIGCSVRLAAHAVGCDQTDAALQAFHRIRQHGYRRIGFVTHPGAEMSSRFRAGFLFAQADTPDVAHPPLLRLGQVDEATDRAALAGWLAVHRPDAILTTDARTRRLLGELGVRVPEDVALAATSVLDGNADAGIDQRPGEIGRAAVEVLDGLLTRGRFGPPAVPRMTSVLASWVDGNSLPPRETARSTG